METNARCGRCGKELSSGEEVYCPACRGDVRLKNRKRLRHAAVAVVILFLAGSVFWYANKNSWEFSWDALMGKPVAVVNGEPIARSAVRERLNISRHMLEKQYGNDLFAGERGRALLTDLERDVLEKMMEEQLVAQEARRINIKVGDDRVRQELQSIGREIYGNWENFQASLKEDGISSGYLFDHVRNLILLQEVKKAKAPPGVNPDEYFNIWFVQTRQNARITVNKTISPVQVSAQGQGSCSCCGSGGGVGCGGRGGVGCGTKQAGPLDPELESKASAAVLVEYRKNNPAEKGVEAKVTDYGCHVQVDIEKGGRVIRSYTYQDGSVIDNS